MVLRWRRPEGGVVGVGIRARPQELLDDEHVTVLGPGAGRAGGGGGRG